MVDLLEAPAERVEQGGVREARVALQRRRSLSPRFRHRRRRRRVDCLARVQAITVFYRNRYRCRMQKRRQPKCLATHCDVIALWSSYRCTLRCRCHFVNNLFCFRSFGCDNDSILRDPSILFAPATVVLVQIKACTEIRDRSVHEIM